MSGGLDYYILLRDRKVVTVAWSIPGVYTKKSEIDISKGDLLVRKGDLLYPNGNESAAFEFNEECGNVAPLENVQYNLLKAIPTAKARVPVFVTDGWMDWGAGVKKGDEVYIRVIKDGIECCSTAVVHYIGTLTGDNPGTMFGVEITDSRCHGCGTSDGTFHLERIFSCPDNNGLFLSLASVAKQSDWLKLEYRPKRDIPALTEGMQKDDNIAPIPAKRSTKEPPQASASSNVEVKSASVNANNYGAKVIVTAKDGKKFKGTIKWTGQLPLEGGDPKKKIPVYGVETDISISYNHFEPIVALKGRPQFSTNCDHGRVFIPQYMVELDEQKNGSGTTEKSRKDCHTETRVDDEGRRHAALMVKNEKAALAIYLGPEIAKETDIEEQKKALEGFKKAKQHNDNAAPDKGLQAGKDAATLKLEKEKEALALDLGPEIAKETNIEEQMKALEEFKKSKQREDNTAPNKDMYAGRLSADSQYPGVQQNYPQSNSQLNRQSSYTQDPHQGSHQPSAQGHWAAQQQIGIGSAVVVSNSNPPIGGTIRWIGTIPQVNGHIVGVELEAPMDGCTDGVWSQNGVHYFDCPPNKGYFCMLETLMPDQRFMTANKYLNNPMKYISEDVSVDVRADSTLFDKYLGEEKGIQGHQNSCYLDATLFGLFSLSSSFDELFLHDCKTEKNQLIKNIIWKKIVNPLRSCGAARYESVMALRERLDDLGKMKGITKDEKDPEEFLNMLFKLVLHTDPFIEIRRPYGTEGEFFVQLFLESEASTDAAPKISDMLHRMFTEQDLSFTKAPLKLLIQVPRFGKQFKTFKRVIPDKALNVSKLVHTDENGFCFWCNSPATCKCEECNKLLISKEDNTTDGRMCGICSERRHKNTKYKGHNPVALPKQADIELDLLSVICIETSHYVCFTRANDRWLFFDSMANRIGDKYNIPCCTECTEDINGWVYRPEKLLSTELKPELVRRFTQDVYMCVYVAPDADLY